MKKLYSLPLNSLYKIMSKREEALRAFNEHFAFKDNAIAWSAWKMAWDLAYNRAIDDAVNRLIFGGDKIANINEDDLAGLIELKVG